MSSPAKSKKDDPSSPATHVSFFSDEDDEEKKVDDDGVPLLPVNSSRKYTPRRKSKPRGSEKKNAVTKTSKSEEPIEGVAPTAYSSRFKKKAEKKAVEKPRFRWSGWNRRGLSSMGLLERRNSTKNLSIMKVSKAADHDDDDDIPHAEEDPVIQIFESRNTQRVRFALEGNEAPTKPLVTTEKKYEDSSTDESKTSGANIKQFMSRALFGSTKSSNKLNEEMKAEVASLGGGSLVWESAATSTGPEVIHTTKSFNSGAESSELRLSFTEDPKARAKVSKLLEKASKAENMYFRYEYAVKCYLRVLNLLKEAKYPDDHPIVVRTVDLLNNAHHVLSSYNNSANIVKMGIKYEDSGELVRALKMYTIAYRIRRDNLSRNHPSLVVLLNMLGSIQIKRGELKEAMQIYELALSDSVVMLNSDEDVEQTEKLTSNLLAKSVTYREMGVIYERWDKVDEALQIYHKSLECVLEWKKAVLKDSLPSEKDAKVLTNLNFSLNDLHLTKAVSDRNTSGEGGEMEVFFGSPKGSSLGISKNKENTYESFFPARLDAELEQKNQKSENANVGGRKRTRQDVHADMDLALTLHQIAQLHRCQGEYGRALDAYVVALRGMKYALGKHHPNVAAVLGNIGNLQKEMGDMDAAYSTYQEVLGIESYRLGLSHPDVAITLHNIATIDAARGNYEHSLQLYRKVIGLEKKLFGGEHISVAVAAACMGDVYEKIGEYSNAMESYEDAVRIKSLCLGRHSPDVARLLHKLGKLAFLSKDYHMAESFLSRATLMYRLNKIDEEHQWMVDANRDAADIDAALAIRGDRHFEC